MAGLELCLCACASTPSGEDPAAPEVTKGELGEAGEGASGEAGPSEGKAAKTLLVASESGLHEYDLDGKELRRLSSSPASWPRILADGSLLFLSTKDEALALMRVDTKGEESTLATLARGFDLDTCQPAAASGDWTLDVQLDFGFRVDEAKNVACIDLADRNPNMMDLELSVRVDLGSGEQTSALRWDNTESCPVDHDFECEGVYAAERPGPGEGPSSAEFAWQWDPSSALLFPSGAATDPKARRVCLDSVDLDDPEDLDYGCAHEEGRSGSGRFVLISGMSSEGDYIHRELFLIDLESGELLAIYSEGESFRAVTPAELMSEGLGSLDAVGESDLRWVGEGGQDRLWVDGMLIDPLARRLEPVGGDLAWSM